MEVISRQEAKAKGLDRYFTGKQCKHGHFSERYTKYACCIACLHDYRNLSESKKWMASYNKNRRKSEEYKDIEKKNREKPERKKTKAEYLKCNKMKEWRRQYQKNKEQSDIVYKLKRRSRGLIRGSFSRLGIKKPEKTEAIIGCDINKFKEHIESLFSGGMSWGNINKWHIDHIIPLASAKTVEDVVRLCHYTNLQPLWAKDNLKKGAKIL